MTGAQRQMVSTWYVQAKELVQLAGGVILICGTILGLILWFTGGLKPQNQVTVDALTTKVDNIQKDTADIKQAMGALPHPYEFDEQRAHLSRLDGLIADEKAATSGIDGRVTALERAQGQYRNPKN